MAVPDLRTAIVGFLTYRENTLAFIPVPDVVQVELMFLYSGEVAQNVLHYKASEPWTPELMTDLADAISDWWNDIADSTVSSAVSLTSLILTDMSSATGYRLVYTGGLPKAGTVGGDPMPNNVAMVITKETGFRGRTMRGRIFHMGLPESYVIGNTVSGTPLNDIITAWRAARELARVEAVYTMQVVSLELNNAPRTEGLATPVSAMTSTGNIRTQRRRLPRR